MRVVLITGCSSGFGLETSIAFARRGDVVIATMRNPEKAAPLLERAGDEGVTVEVLTLDVTSTESIAACVEKVTDRHGGIDVLVNNAGIVAGGAIETMDLEIAHSVLETNFWGSVRTIQAVLPGMRARGAGVIVNVSSISARIPPPPYGAWYSVSKHAVSVLSESLSMELHGTGVRVVSIEPGFYRTEIMANTVSSSDAPADSFYAADEAWIERFFVLGALAGGDPREVANAIVGAADDPATPLHVVLPLGAEEWVLGMSALPFETTLANRIEGYESSAGPRPER